jgi:hypothetical protein
LICGRGGLGRQLSRIHIRGSHLLHYHHPPCCCLHCLITFYRTIRNRSATKKNRAGTGRPRRCFSRVLPLPPAAARCRPLLPLLFTNHRPRHEREGLAEDRRPPRKPRKPPAGMRGECAGVGVGGMRAVRGKWGSQWECVGMRGSAAAPWECVGIIASRTALRTGMGGDGNAWECVWECQAPLSRTP